MRSRAKRNTTHELTGPRSTRLVHAAADYPRTSDGDKPNSRLNAVEKFAGFE